MQFLLITLTENMLCTLWGSEIEYPILCDALPFIDFWTRPWTISFRHFPYMAEPVYMLGEKWRVLQFQMGVDTLTLL